MSVGEPNMPIGTGVRNRGGSFVGAEQQIMAADHDLHLANLTPSVTVINEPPETIEGSWYRGYLHAGLKDVTFQPSSALRHMVELKGIVERHYSGEGGSVPPMMAALTDGGPDHNTEHYSVIIAWIAFFLALDLDFLVATRTAPGQSFQEPAERAMSAINLLCRMSPPLATR